MYAGVWLALAALLAGDVGEDMFGAISRGGGCVRHAPRPEIGHLVVIKDLADVHLAFKGTPTTAVLEQAATRRPTVRYGAASASRPVANRGAASTG